MTAIAGATPLIALRAVALDTETTGLDPRAAWIVQVGAVRIEAGAVTNDRFETLINPGQPIPPGATAVHHIADADVADVPSFADAAGRLAGFIAGDVMIGHTLNFDLRILEREHARAGLAWTAPRALDTRLLARLAEPSLAHDDLDSLCARFAITNQARHRALGDAIATAHLFLALLPRLRERGLRTLAEAEMAQQRLMERDTRAAGGLLIGSPPRERDRALIRIDSFPYRHRIADVMTTPPLTAAATDTVAAAIAVLAAGGMSSVFVARPPAPDRELGAHLAADWGIVTEHDILRALHRGGKDALAERLDALASWPLAWVDQDDYVYRAIGRMTRLGVRHLGVRDEAGALVGAVTARNLLGQRAMTAIVLGDRVDCAASPAELAAAWADLTEMARGLLTEGVDPRDIAAIISTELRAVTRRAAELAEAAMRDADAGPPPVPYCVLVLGSGGRGESLLAADQDNAIVYRDGEPDGPADRWFAAMAERMNAILDTAGVPLCKGGVMARNAAWRHSLAGWTALVDHWVRRQRPEDLLDVDIFFDLLPVHGDAALGEAVRAHALAAGRAAPDFLKLLATQAAGARAPLTLFGRIRTDEAGRVDVKKSGLLPLFTAARVLAIRHGLDARSTPDRLRGVAAKGIGAAADIEAIIAAHRILLEAGLRQQLLDAEAGVTLSPLVAPASLPPALRQALPGAFRAVATAVDLVNEGRVA
jgi:DNA polymerase-3 subunit epsilon/CBS domain-containing protein